VGALTHFITWARFLASGALRALLSVDAKGGIGAAEGRRWQTVERALQSLLRLRRGRGAVGERRFGVAAVHHHRAVLRGKGRRDGTVSAEGSQADDSREELSEGEL